MSNISGNTKLRYKTIFPKKVSDFNSELLSCIEQIILAESAISKILYCTAFISSFDSESYSNKKNAIINSLSPQIPVSVVAQMPKKNQVCFELVLIDTTHAKIERRLAKNTEYSLVHFCDETLVIAIGLAGELNQSIEYQSIVAFSKAETILLNENLLFSDIVRQWNYIEDITCEVTTDDKRVQNYQVFNDVRSNFYSKAVFNQGYPAATGIGMQSGGIIIDFIATKANNMQITPLTNPEQIDAHKYSKNVLVGNGQKEKSTPKFERAKALISDDKTTIFVSGTAAIHGESTVQSDCIKKQTHETLDIIDKLVNFENQHKHSIIPKKLICEQIRIYVRRGEKAITAEEIVKNKYPNTPIITVTGNVCRNDLLVEIEAIFGSVN